MTKIFKIDKKEVPYRIRKLVYGAWCVQIEDKVYYGFVNEKQAEQSIKKEAHKVWFD